MAFLPVARPRTEAPAARPVSQWSRWAGIDADTEIPNPWLQPLATLASKDVAAASALDEAHWRAMEQSPAILSSKNKRVSLAISKGWQLRPGRGPQAERLYDVWSAVAERVRFHAFLEQGLHSIFTGWHPIEVVATGPSLIEGRQLRMPEELIAAENSHFAFTAGRDLIHKPPGRFDQWKVWRMQSLGARLKWCLYQQGIGLPYGESIYGSMSLAHYFARVLETEGIIQTRRGAGVPKVSRRGGPERVMGADVETEGEAKARERVKDEIQGFLDQLAGSGVLVVPRGWDVDYFTAQGVFDGWVKVWSYLADQQREAILGGNLIGMAGQGASGSRAAGEVQLQVSIDQARSDAWKVSELVKRRLFHPWTALNAPSLGFSQAGISPSLADVPLEALPSIEFPNLRRPNLEGLQLILDKVRLDPGEAESFRIDLNALAEHLEIPLLREGQEGPFPDLARQPPPVFGSAPGQDQPGQEPEDDGANPSDITDETPDARSGRPDRTRS